MSRGDAFERIDALVGVALRLARTAPSGRLLLARVADAIDPAWIPDPWRETVAPELAAAAEQAREPLDGRRVEAILRDAWDVKPSEELDDLDREPVAITPTAQVHRGELEGRPVAVKVLRPGLAATVRQDLALLEGLLGPLGAAFPGLDAAALTREFRTRVLDELDLENEAGNQRRFHRALRSHERLHVPAAITRLAHEQVMVSEWVDGVPLSEASDTDAACVLLLQFVVGGLRAGLVHADPDPRDVLLLPDGGLAVLDFGAVAEPQPERVELTAAAVEAFAAGDEAAFSAALDDLGALPRDLGPAAMELIAEALGELAGPEPARLDSEAVLRAGARAQARPEALARLLARGGLAPEDLWPARGVAQLFSTIARVGATAAWREELRAALRDGWG